MIALKSVIIQVSTSLMIAATGMSWIQVSAIAQPQRVSGQAIVPLEDLKLPAPTVKGEATLPVSPLDDTHGNLPTLTVMIGDQPHRFLFDTGASTTMVSAELVKQLNLKGEPVPSNRLAVAGKECGQPELQVVSMPPLSLGSIVVENLKALQLSGSKMPPRLSGILGMDVLRQFSLQLDPQKAEVTLRSRLEPPSETAIPLQEKSGVMLTAVMVNGKGPFTMLLDTGAGSTFISPKVADEVGIAANQRQKIQMIGFCGLEDAEISRSDRVTLGTIEQQNVEVVITSSSVLKLLKIDGVLGQNVLQAYRQTWLFSGQSPRLWLTAPERPERSER